ncbi:hypothetical protein DINM_001706 [Dirofilaria immitis]|nr:hypothetical protein [Dirofilaria immitis]
MGQLLGRQKSKGLCTICLEKMPMKNISALRCGHLFHFHCIKYWLIEQTTCPECRQPSTLDDIVTSLYFHDMDDKQSESTDTHSDSDSTDDSSEKLDTYLKFENEKALHKQTKEYLNKIQCENLELMKIIQILVADDGEMLDSSSDES